jgi:hypothetical protein
MLNYSSHKILTRDIFALFSDCQAATLESAGSAEVLADPERHHLADWPLLAAMGLERFSITRVLLY